MATYDLNGMAALVVAITGLVATIGLQIKTIMEQHSSKKRAKARDIKLDEIQSGVNGAAEKLNKVTGDEAFARGVKVGEEHR